MKSFFLMLLLAFGFEFYAQTNVELIANFNPYPSIGYNDIWGYVDQQGNEYALLFTQHGTSIVSLANPSSPVEVKFIPGPPSLWRDGKVHGTYAYVVTEGTSTGRGLQIIDLSQLPANATLEATIETWFTRAHNIFIDNGYAFVIGTNGGGGMHILDLSNPTNPTRTAYYSGSSYIHDVYVWNDTVVACAEDSYDLIDITDKANPTLISVSQSLPGIYAHSGWMTEDKRYFVACEEFDERDITVWDLQDRTSWDLIVPQWQMNNPTPGSGDPVHNLFIKGNYAHISYYKHGYVVLDISDPTQPFMAGNYDTYSSNSGTYEGAWGCYPYLPSGNILLSDMSTGLYVLEFTPDDVAPSITHNPIELKYDSSPTIISANIIDNASVTSANIHYRTTVNGATGNWLTVVDQNGPNGNNYDFEIPGQSNLTFVEYYIAAVDNNSNVTTLPEGGSGINPLGSIPPPNVFAYDVQIPGALLINSINPIGDTTIAAGSFIVFSVDASDTSNFSVGYQWYKNGVQQVSTSNSYNYIANPSLPVPRVDSIRVIASNGFFNFVKIWNVSVDNPSNVIDGTIVTEFALEQNYPNPFNPSTRIRFSIPSSEIVNLTVYNFLGEKITELVNEFKPSGIYEVDFNAASLSSGLYLIKINAGSYSNTIKMNLLK
jgi:choice-of-anchor B domain-containing protein